MQYCQSQQQWEGQQQRRQRAHERDLRRRPDGSSRFDPAPVPDELLRMATAGLGSQVLRFALAISLFDETEQWIPAGELARELILVREQTDAVEQFPSPFLGGGGNPGRAGEGGDPGPEQIALDLTRQMGKPLIQARREVDTTLDRADAMIRLAPAALAAAASGFT